MLLSRSTPRISWTQCRSYAKFSLKKKNNVETSTPTKARATPPARTRFAPSPTGYLHLGSLRTALYNYLLAKSTGGQFLLRLEDTDQTRLVPGAEQNIYDSLKWCNIVPDEGTNEGGAYGPYRQSDRTEIYQKYVQILIDKGLAYRCTCSKERLNDLRESAQQLKPPTTVTYDRKCLHHPDGGDHNASVVRFKSPDSYDDFTDLLHGRLNLQPQYNYSDRRYDDIVIMKSDGLPTYHFANVVDDHLMKITHVIRGEEWLPSTPKHIALYKAFGWTPPAFVHIPLLTSLEDKKLSKRQGDIGILSMKDKGILPEAIVNFVALFGWSPHRETPGILSSESMDMQQLIKSFSLDNLTRGNAKVNDSKLYFFNKFHINEAIKDEKRLDSLVVDLLPAFSTLTKDQLKQLVKYLGPSLTTLNEIETIHSYCYSDVDYSQAKPPPAEAHQILQYLLNSTEVEFELAVKQIVQEFPSIKKPQVFQTVRYALSGGTSGLSIPLLIDFIGDVEYKNRLQKALDSL